MYHIYHIYVTYMLHIYVTVICHIYVDLVRAVPVYLGEESWYSGTQNQFFTSIQTQMYGGSRQTQTQFGWPVNTGIKR